jgi:hypothetical protein
MGKTLVAVMTFIGAVGLIIWILLGTALAEPIEKVCITPEFVQETVKNSEGWAPIHDIDGIFAKLFMSNITRVRVKVFEGVNKVLIWPAVGYLGSQQMLSVFENSCLIGSAQWSVRAVRDALGPMS